MRDSTIYAQNLARLILKSDFGEFPALYSSVAKSEMLDTASTRGRTGFSSISLRRNVVRGKSVYQLNDIEDIVLLRHINAGIKRVTNVKQDDRKFIIACIKSLCREGTSFRLYKLDIKSFYESTDPGFIINKLEQDIGFSGQSVRLLSSLFRVLVTEGIFGLPRGLAISATIAEYLLRDFDREASSLKHVHYMSRFVDDICLITDGQEDVSEFSTVLSSLLPTGLTFNNKSAVYSFSEYQKLHKTSVEEHTFDFLGYSVRVSHAYRDGQIIRDVHLDIATKKVKRFKTRIAKSLLDYKITKDFPILLRRIQLLTSNFAFVDLKTERRKLTGIYYNYPLVDVAKSSSLKDLDSFMRQAVCSRHKNNKLYPGLSPAQRNRILRLSFHAGFVQRRFFSFKAHELVTLIRCWKHA